MFSFLLLGAIVILGVVAYAIVTLSTSQRAAPEKPLTDALDQLNKDQDAFAQYRSEKATEHFNSIQALIELKTKVEEAGATSTKKQK